MVEAGANEISEAEILDALDIAHSEIKKSVRCSASCAAKVGKEKTPSRLPAVDEGLLGEIRASHGSALDAATQVEDKLERQDACKAVEGAILEQYAPPRPRVPARSSSTEAKARRAAVQLAFDKLEKAIIRERIAVHKKRPDGRAENEIREITIEVGVTPRTHGSALFTRGQTQALSVAALGTLKEEMRLDTLGLADQEVLLPPLQLPALLGGRGRPSRPQAPRHRSRRAGRAGARAGGALDRGLPLHDPRRLGHLRVKRLLLDGLGVRLLAVADGRGRADQAPGGGYRDGPDQGGRRLHRAHRHRRRGGPPGRHGLQGGRHRSGHHRPADGHQDHGRHVRDPARRAHAGPRGAHVHPRQDGRGDRGAARVAQPVRSAHPDDPDRPLADRPVDRQGRRNDPRALRGVRVPDRRQRRRPGADLLRQRQARRRAAWSACG